MKSIINLSELPASGVLVIVEGVLIRLFFDFEPHVAPEGEEQPENLYDCVNVGRGRMGMTYSNLSEPLFRLFAPYEYV